MSTDHAQPADVEAASTLSEEQKMAPPQTEARLDHSQWQTKRLTKPRGRRKVQQPGVTPSNGESVAWRNRSFPRLNGNDSNAREGLAPRRHRELFPAGTYKTEICRSHLHHGYCEYGLSCQFAHGIGELRPRHFDVKYKTQLCKNYHKDGSCRFGSRCKFIHDEHRIQVDTNEFWLVSPSENLVRVEIVENIQRRQQLQALVESPPPPPPNQGAVDAELEEKKKQVLANARVAAARAAAARAAMQHATKTLVPTDALTHGSAFLNSVPSMPPSVMSTQPQQLVNSISASEYYEAIQPYNLIPIPLDAGTHPMLTPGFQAGAANVHVANSVQGVPFYVPLS